MSKEKQMIEEMAKVICAVCAKGESPCALAESGRMCDAAWEEAEAFYNADYRKQSEWISVEERLPKEVEHIIVCDEDGTVGEAIFLKATARFEWVDNEEIAFATHWMPLPEPPKMKGGADDGGKQ